MARGLHLHATLAVNPDGLALGVLRAAFDAPAPPNPDENDKPKPREERLAPWALWAASRAWTWMVRPRGRTTASASPDPAGVERGAGF